MSLKNNTSLSESMQVCNCCENSSSVAKGLESQFVIVLTIRSWLESRF